MRRLAAGAFVLGIVATFGQTIPSHAAVVDGPSGFLCGFTSTTDPGTEGGDVQTGEIDAGPLLAVDDTTTPPTAQTGTVKCTIQVGGATHAAPDNGASASASGTGVIVLPATLVSYNSPANVPVYLCTEFTFQGGPTIYFDDPNDPTVDGDWTDDPNSDCGLATSVETPTTCTDLINLCQSVDSCTGAVNVCLDTDKCDNTINVCTGASQCTGTVANVCTGDGTSAPVCNGGGVISICRPALRRSLAPEQRSTRHSDLTRRALDGHFRGARR